ncbi:MAG: phosphopantetheine-binding protein, partial [Actinomycetota bacterium]|nr:phosphopantetheine-binding protein [Actinomycetota bacterium]
VWCCPDDGAVDAEAPHSAVQTWPAFALAVAKCEKAAPDNLDPANLHWFARQYAAAHLMTSLGVPIAHAIGTGRGALVAMAIIGDLDLRKALGRLAAGDLPAAAEPPVPAWLTFEWLAVTGPTSKATPVDILDGTINVPWSGDRVLETLAALYESGVDIQWDEQYTNRPRRAVTLPTYPFEPTRVWITDQFPVTDTSRPPATAPVPDEVASCSLTGEGESCSLDDVELGLAAIDRAPLSAEGYESVVCSIWADTVGAAGLTSSDDYFELGGTSAMALQMLTAVRRRFGVRLKLIDLYEARTVAEFAARIADLDGAVPAKDTTT